MHKKKFHLYLTACLLAIATILFSFNYFSPLIHPDSIKTERDTTVQDTAEEAQAATIVGYLIGKPPKGLDAVLDELNTRLKKDLNAKLDLHYLSWSDYRTKYPLMLAAQENVDFIFTADWCMYTQEATKNAFYEITQDDLEKNMPLHYANCPPEAYKEALINGKLFMIPCSTPDERVSCLLYRKDLAQKYKIEDLERLHDFAPYFKAIAENETDIVPMKISASYDNIWLALANEDSNEFNLFNGLCYYTAESSTSLTPLYEKPFADTLSSSFQTMKNWYDAGYINKDVLANETTSAEAFANGSSAIALGNSIDIQNVLAVCKEKGYEVGIIPLLDANGKTSRLSYLNSGVAITAFSKNPALTMKVLDFIMEDQDYNLLTYFGIEGTNYIITDDGKIGLPDGVTNKTNSYPVDASGFWFSNKKQYPPMDSWTEEYTALRQRIPTMLYNNAPISFPFDLEPIQTETLSVNDVLLQYLQPLCYGITNDTDDSMQLLKERLKAAGIEKINEYANEQLHPQ